jgi:hypothetical protein
LSLNEEHSLPIYDKSGSNHVVRPRISGEYIYINMYMICI